VDGGGYFAMSSACFGFMDAVLYFFSLTTKPVRNAPVVLSSAKHNP